MRACLAIGAFSLVVFVAGGCGGANGSAGGPTSVARVYEEAIVAKDGNRLCGTFAPKLREVTVEQLREQGGTNARRITCPAFYDVVLKGFPHENINRQFTGAKLIDVGGSQRIRRGGIVYARVSTKVAVKFVFTGYSAGHAGEKGTALVRDAVWLAKGADGAWRIVKPSLVLYAVNSPDALYDRRSLAKANLVPPDPDYSMNRAERTAWEAADYRRSFRRAVRHALRCRGQTTTVKDPPHDGVAYPTGSGLHPAPAPLANNVTRVTVAAATKGLCVVLTFRSNVSGQLSIGFIPRSRREFYGEYVVELEPGRGVRGGGLTTGYRYFRGGERLRRAAVGQIAVYGNTIAFLANTGPVPADLAWNVLATNPQAADRIPNAGPAASLSVRQRDARVVAP